jgi:Restriction endonuclease fold toxin 9
MSGGQRPDSRLHQCRDALSTADPDNALTALWSGELLLRALRIDLLSLLVCAFTAFSGGCADSRSADALAVEIAIAEQPVPAATGAIFPAESAAAVLEQCTREIPARLSEFWSPEPPVNNGLRALGNVLEAASSTSGENGSTIRGRDEHAQYSARMRSQGYTTNRNIPGTNLRPDAIRIDGTTGIIRELKPNTVEAIRRGTRQLRRYLTAARQAWPHVRTWTTAVDPY